MVPSRLYCKIPPVLAGGFTLGNGRSRRFATPKEHHRRVDREGTSIHPFTTKNPHSLTIAFVLHVSHTLGQ